ncbi:uncharacterized protein JCM6883_003695 [Sporobolomyces salmoneus]|uniref:uncharacterized protein n=1 Tax=Sporobolomyces salmoneus TaxID=183962 RepID=UPI0031797766
MNRAPDAEDGESDASSSTDVQMRLVPNTKIFATQQQPQRITVDSGVPVVRKAARKSTGPARLASAPERHSRRKPPRRTSPPRSSTEAPLLGSYVATPPSQYRLDDLPFPFSIDVRLDSFHELSLPYPCLVTHQFSLPLRHDCQSSAQATDFAVPSTISEWLDAEEDISSTLARTTFVLLDYPPLPLVESFGAVSQRSEVLLRYKLLSVSNDSLFEATIPLSKERRLERVGVVKSKRRSDRGGVAIFSYEVKGDQGEGSARETTEEVIDEVKNDLESRLKKCEEEWREEVVERERIQQLLTSQMSALRTRTAPTGFKKTASLIPGLEGNPKPPVSDLPPFLPIPKYEFVQYSTRAVPVSGQPLEVFPQLDGWEDAESTNRFVDEKVAECMTYSPNSDEDEEKVKEEEAWNKVNLVSRKTLEGLDPGHVRRDFETLDGLFENLNLDREELARRVKTNSGRSQRWTDPVKDDLVVSSLFRHFEERLGISPDEVHRNHRLLSEQEVIVSEELIDYCEFCGTICSIHDPLFAYNAPLASNDSKKDSQGGCESCQDEKCRARKMKPKASTKQQERQLEQLVKELPNLNRCTAAIVLERPVKEITSSFPEVAARPEKPAGKLRSSKFDEADWITQQSNGYTPCDCESQCDTQCNCVTSRSFCDRFCGCPPRCLNRFKGCDCHASAETLGNAYPGCCMLKLENDCPCRELGRACDPRLCSPCDTCLNMQIQRVEPKATIFTLSSVPNGGYGLVALENIRPGQFVGCYAGESFTTETNSWDSNGYGAWKASWSERARISFWFNLDQEHSVDSQEIGNLLRFINHRRKPMDNCGASVTYVDGTHQIALAATENLGPGTELFLDYGKEYMGAF